MNIFGNQTDVRIAVFAEGTVPKPSKLKKMFSCSSVKVYKGWGQYQRELDAIYSAHAAKAALNGQTYQARHDVEMVVMGPEATYNVFAVASKSESLVGRFRLNATLFDQLNKLTAAASRIGWQSRTCQSFVHSMKAINEIVTDIGVSDPIVQSFDAKTFLAQYGECGQAGLRAILELIAAEIPNLSWAADAPVQVADPKYADTEEAQEQKAA